MPRSTETRRSFLKKAAIAAPMVLSANVLARGANAVSPNEKLNIGLIGCGNRCRAIVSAGMEYPEFQMVAVADCFEPQTRRILDHYKADWNAYTDFRKMIETENLDGASSPAFDRALIGVYDAGFNPVLAFGPDINYFPHSNWEHLFSNDFKPALDSYAVTQFRLGFYFDTIDASFNDYEGWYIDDLRIHDGETPPIPEPSTWLLLSTGLLGIGAAARRRFFG